MKTIFGLIILIILSSCINSDPPELPQSLNRPQRDTTRKNIVVTINRDQTYLIGQRKCNFFEMDSILHFKVDSILSSSGSPMVVINADSFIYYHVVMSVMQSATRAGAKVIANVK